MARSTKGQNTLAPTYIHTYMYMSGLPFWWPMEQVCIKHPCTQDLSSSPTGLFRSFTASRALSWLCRWISNWITYLHTYTFLGFLYSCIWGYSVVIYKIKNMHKITMEQKYLHVLWKEIFTWVIQLLGSSY